MKTNTEISTKARPPQIARRPRFSPSPVRMAMTGVPFGAMSIPTAPFVMPRKRGNPNWGKPARPGPVLPTEFEMQVRQLRLTAETYVFSAELRSWCERNRNRCYIPEWLLEAWDISVTPDFSGAT